jgi:hypothetical protein
MGERESCLSAAEFMEFPHTQIIRELRNCGATFDEMPQVEHSAHIQSWLHAYGDFYNQDRSRIRGARAIEEAQRLSDDKFLVVPCRDPSFSGWSAVGTAYRCRSNRLPDLTEASHYVDVFISPEDFSWTLLYGHEVDVLGGPDFSRRDWVTPNSIERIQKREWGRGHA